jgi:hypothetical protein
VGRWVFWGGVVGFRFVGFCFVVFLFCCGMLVLRSPVGLLAVLWVLWVVFFRACLPCVHGWKLVGWGALRDRVLTGWLSRSLTFGWI